MFRVLSERCLPPRTLQITAISHYILLNLYTSSPDTAFFVLISLLDDLAHVRRVGAPACVIKPLPHHCTILYKHTTMIPVQVDNFNMPSLEVWSIQLLIVSSPTRLTATRGETATWEWWVWLPLGSGYKLTTWSA